MADGRWCDLCGDNFTIDNMVYVCCGTYICDGCILVEADKIKHKRNNMNKDRPDWDDEDVRKSPIHGTK